MARLVWTGIIAGLGALLRVARARQLLRVDGGDGSAGAAGTTSGGSAAPAAGRQRRQRAGSGGIAGGGGGGTGGASGSGGGSGSSGSSGASGGGGTSGSSGSGGVSGGGGTGGTTASCSLATTCKPNEICTEVCGMCGTRSRLCDSTGKWRPGAAKVGRLPDRTDKANRVKCGTPHCSTNVTGCQARHGEGSCSQALDQPASCPPVRCACSSAMGCNWERSRRAPRNTPGKSSPLTGRREFSCVERQ
jgi:hypothetical protein